MDFLFTSAQLALQKMVADFTKKEIAPIAQECDKSGEFPMEIYKKYAEMGLHCPLVPEEYDGAGLDMVSTVIVTEEISKGCAGFASAIAALELACSPVIAAGTPQQKEDYFAPLAAGGMASFCLTEPNAGSDAGSVQTRAVREGDEYIISGNKRFITNARFADRYTVIAKVNEEKGTRGLAAFIVEGDRPGITVGKAEDKLGIRCSDTSEISFDNVRIPVSNLLGAEGDGFKLAMGALDAGRVLCAAMSLGVAQCALDHAVEYSQQRVQFGKPICANQSMQFTLADMATEIEAARQLTYYSAYLMDQHAPNAVKVASMAKTFASDVAMKVTVDAVQVYGGCGYVRDYPMEKLMRDAKIMQIIEGTNQVQRIVIAKNLLAGV